MGQPNGFRIRLRVRLPKAFNSSAISLDVDVGDKEVTIASQMKDEQLRQAKWIVLTAGGFATDAEALQFGNRLRLIVQLAALSSRLGVDAGQDRSSAWIREDFARSMGLIEPHQRIVPNVHGLVTYPDDGNTRIPIVEIQGAVRVDPEGFRSALTELGGSSDLRFGRAENAVQLLNRALMASDHLGQMVLAFSAVEELGQDEEWTDSQLRLIGSLVRAAEGATEGTQEERAEVADRIRKGLFRLGQRQGVLRLLASLDLAFLRKEWDRLYGIRSGLFHGTTQLSDAEIASAAADTITLCGRIILGALAEQGVPIPSIARRHFFDLCPGGERGERAPPS